jgi:hypothetical protein
VVGVGDWLGAVQRRPVEQCAIPDPELGRVVPSPPRRIFKIDACADTGWEFVWIYRCQSEGPFSLHPDEIDYVVKYAQKISFSSPLAPLAMSG